MLTDLSDARYQGEGREPRPVRAIPGGAEAAPRRAGDQLEGGIVSRGG